MEVLKDKSYKTYDAISRYASFPFFYNKVDRKYIYGITGQLGDATSFILYNLNQKDTLDSLALKYYGRPDYYWVIADFNRIKDPYDTLYPKYKSLKIPTLSAISFEPVR